MSLLDKNWTGLLFCAALSIFSCEDPSEVGLGLDPDGIESGVFYEEIFLPAQNVFIDSLITSNSSRLLVGRTPDDTFGITVSRAYFPIVQSTSSRIAIPYKIDTVSLDPLELDTAWGSYVLKKAELALQYDYINTKDAIGSDAKMLTPQTIRIQEIGDKLFSGVYYMSNFETPLLALETGNEFTFNPSLAYISNTETTQVDTAYFTLNQSWADRLWEVLSNSDITISDEFKGLSLVSGENNTAIVGFNLGGATGINLQYEIEIDTTVNGANNTVTTNRIVYNDSTYVAKFSFQSTSAANYNYIQTDRTGSVVGNSIGGHLENFNTNDGLVYLHHASGIYPKIDLAPFKEFLEDPENELVQISNLEFEMPVIRNITLDYDTLINANDATSRAYFIGETGHINMAGILSGSSSAIFETGIFSYQSGSLGYMPLFVDTSFTKVRGAATYFAQAVEGKNILYDDEKEEWLLDHLIMMPSEKSTVNRSIIKADSIKLKIYYSNPN